MNLVDSREESFVMYVLDYDGTAKRGLFNTDNDSESDFLFFLLHCQKVAVKKENYLIVLFMVTNLLLIV